MRSSLLLAILLASASTAAGHSQPIEERVASRPERCSEERLDQLVDEAAKAEETLIELEQKIGPSPSEKEEVRLVTARADSAAAHADAFSISLECSEEKEQSHREAQGGGL